jgi:hypothetical protein
MKTKKLCVLEICWSFEFTSYIPTKKRETKDEAEKEDKPTGNKFKFHKENKNVWLINKINASPISKTLKNTVF